MCILIALLSVVLSLASNYGTTSALMITGGRQFTSALSAVRTKIPFRPLGDILTVQVETEGLVTELDWGKP